MRIRSLGIAVGLMLAPLLVNAATVTPTVAPSGAVTDFQMVTWTALANGDSGASYGGQYPVLAERTFQVIGTFGAGGSINFEGSNDGTNWEILTDAQGTSITKTASGIETVCEVSRFVRPRVTAGDVTTSLTVILLLKRVN